MIITVQFDDKTIGYFLEKPLKGIVGDYELSGIVDGMVATVVRDPKKPFFCMHKYKRSVDNDGQPDAQALASMLVVKQKKIAENLFMAYILWV